MPSTYPKRLFCVVAVHNRAATTRHLLEQLRAQSGVELRVIVVDDGSTDDTAGLLAEFQGLSLRVVQGSGNLWWGGAMRLGMKVADSEMELHDALLMLNDDIVIAHDFAKRFADRAGELGPGVLIGCRQRAADASDETSFGYRIDYKNCRIDEVTRLDPAVELCEVDAVCGRGVLVSREVVRRMGYVDAARFPHYLGDVEYSARAKDHGYRVVCDATIVVSTSFNASDAKRVGGSRWKRFLSPVSSKNVLQHYRFWARRGPKTLTRTALLRFPLTKLSRAMRSSARPR